MIAIKLIFDILCLVAVLGALAYGVLLAGGWLVELWRDWRAALDDDPARDVKRDSKEED